MNRKKIIFVITKSVWGGAQKYVWQLVANLPKDEFETAVAAGGSGPLVEKLYGSGIRVFRIPYLERDINVFKEILSLWTLLRIFVHERPDIIHLNSSKAGGLGAAAGRIASFVSGHRAYIVFTAHGWAFSEDRTLLERGFIIFFTWLGSLFQNKIITINTMDYHAAQTFIPRKKLALIFNGIEASALLPREETRNFIAQKIRVAIDSDTPLIGTNSELTKNKGLSFLLVAARQVASRHPEIPFKLIMIGDGEDRKKLEKEIIDLGLTHHVFFAGFIPEAQRYLTAFDIFAMPSLKEGLPYAMLEAMRAGLPVIATCVGGILDLIRDGETGIIITPKNPQELADGFVSLLQNPEKRRTFGKKAQETVLEKFSMEHMIQETMRLYRTHAQ